MYNIAGVVFLVVAVGAGVVSLATSHWEELDQHGHRGLFQTCKEFPSKEMILCYNNLEGKQKDNFIENDWYMVSLVCHCVAVFCSFVGCILWFTTFCHLGTGTRATSIFLVIIASACYIASVIVWTFKFVSEDPHDRHGWSFWCAVGAAAATPIATVLMIISAVYRKGYTLVSTS